MALVIDLKPHEKILVGSTIITNDKQRTRLRIEGDAPILREKDTMDAKDATSPAKKLYFTIQSMYVANSDRAMEKFEDYTTDLIHIRALAPHVSDFLNDISIEVLQGTYYKALKLVQDLITAEEGGKEPRANAAPPKPDKFNQAFMEAQLLNQSAEQLQNLYDEWNTRNADEIESVISYNRKLWMVFFDGVNDKNGTKNTKNKDQFDITHNIINLYNYIYKRSADILSTKDSEKLKSLIFINQETATALRRG